MENLGFRKGQLCRGGDEDVHELIRERFPQEDWQNADIAHDISVYLALIYGLIGIFGIMFFVSAVVAFGLLLFNGFSAASIFFSVACIILLGKIFTLVIKVRKADRVVDKLCKLNEEYWKGIFYILEDITEELNEKD